VTTILEHPEVDSDHWREALFRQPGESLLHFGADHPTLTATVGNVIDTLVQIGV
jgi:hypothetical protein